MPAVVVSKASHLKEKDPDANGWKRILCYLVGDSVDDADSGDQMCSHALVLFSPFDRHHSRPVLEFQIASGRADGCPVSIHEPSLFLLPYSEFTYAWTEKE